MSKKDTVKKELLAAEFDQILQEKAAQANTVSMVEETRKQTVEILKLGETVDSYIDTVSALETKMNTLNESLEQFDKLNETFDNIALKINNMNAKYEKLNAETVTTIKDLTATIMAPKEVIRDKNGQIRTIKIKKGS